MYSTLALQLSEQFILKLPPLILINYGWVVKAQNEVIEDLASCSLCGLVRCSVSLGKLCDPQNVINITLASLQLKGKGKGDT